jgi:ABC-type phosphate transport system substrate-binding protein
LRSFSLSLVTALILSGSLSRAVAATDTSVRIVVHPQVKGTQIPRAALIQIFLKQAPRWADGSPVLPVDQSVKAPVRSTFSNRLLEQPLMDVQIYWQRRMSAGVTPPPVKVSDEEVIAYVAANPGAIGYVSSSTPLSDTVKSIDITE